MACLQLRINIVRETDVHSEKYYKNRENSSAGEQAGLAILGDTGEIAAPVAFTRGFNACVRNRIKEIGSVPYTEFSQREVSLDYLQ